MLDEVTLELGNVQPLGHYNALGPSWWCNTEVHLRDQQMVVSPEFCSTDGLRDSNVLSVPLPDDYVVQQMPMLGTRVHPRRLITGRKTKDCVSDEKTMGGTSFQQEESVAVTLANSVLPKHTFPRRVVTPDTDVKIAQIDELVSPGYGRDGILQILIEPFFHLVGVSHGRGVGAEQCDEYFLGEWEAGSHQAIVDPLRGNSQLIDQVKLDFKTNTCLASLNMSEFDTEKRTASRMLCQLAFLC